MQNDHSRWRRYPRSSPFPAVPLPPGWSAASDDRVVRRFPLGYPAAQPDCFWADPRLRLANGYATRRTPGRNCATSSRFPALWFSWHLSEWRPSHAPMTTYARFILTEVSKMPAELRLTATQFQTLPRTTC